jgi:hypothetical protein
MLTPCSRHDEAARWWRRYLALDVSSPWAPNAKRALKSAKSNSPVRAPDIVTLGSALEDSEDGSAEQGVE